MDKTNIRGSRRLLFTAVLPLVFFLGIIVGNNVDIRSSNGSTRINVGSQSKLDYSTVDEMYSTLLSSYDGEIDGATLIEGIKKGLAEATGDPYTEYMTATETTEFNEQLNGSFEGIGAELGKESNAVIIVAPLKGYPAQKAGLQPKDVILRIDGEDALSLSITEAVKKIRGPKGTSVNLDILRGSEQLEFSIQREEIKIASVEHEILEGNIGYIRISRFSEDTNKLVAQAADEFEREGVDSVILDLRNNPGGLLDQSIRVASHWVGRGDAVVVEKRGGKVIRTHSAILSQKLKSVKTVVLINEGSASASEIVAGALKDYDLATLVGQKTFGKGSIQEINKLSGSSSLKVTIARWFTPNGVNIDKEGIEPDETVEFTKEDIEADRDPQKQRAQELLR